MSNNFVVNGNIQYPPSPSAQVATTPIGLTIAYTQKVDDQLVFNAPVTAQAINFGTLTNPKAVYLEVLSGACTIKLATGDSTVINLSLSNTPQPTDRAVLLLANPAGLGALPMVVTVAQACTLKVVAVQ